MKRNLLVALIPLIVLVVAGCSSSSNTVSSADPGTDFSRLQTFGFVKVPDTDGGQYTSLETNYLKTGYLQSDNGDNLRFQFVTYLKF